MTTLEFTQWTPDLPSYGTKGLRVANNVYPGALGYRPVGSFVGDVGALPSACLGAAAFTSPEGTSSLIAGTATDLYRVFSGAWSSIGSGYSVQGDARWRFAQFGGIAIATNGADAMQKIDLKTGVASPLGGNPPRAKVLAVVKDFLVAGVVNGQTNQIAWCGINNAEFWTYGQNQSDFNISPSGGEINGLFGGEYGLILQRNRITRMEYTGGNEIFVINEISSNFGCVSVHSVVQHGQYGWFLSDNGFMMWDGSGLKPIGNERIDRYFLATYNRASWLKMSAAVDIRNQVVVWSMGDRQFVYHWNLDKWTTVSLATEIVFAGVTRSISIDETDILVGANDDNLDYPGLLPLDDESFKGGDAQFYVFNASHAMGRLTGPALEATITLADTEIANGRQTRVRAVRPDTDAVAGVTVDIACRARLGDAVTANSYSVLMPSGDMPVRESGRYARMTVKHAAGSAWTYSNALELVAVAGMKR